jgi:hypothetical protein
LTWQALAASFIQPFARTTTVTGPPRATSDLCSMVPVAAVSCFVSSAAGNVETTTSACSLSDWRAPGWPAARESCVEAIGVSATARAAAMRGLVMGSL